MEDTERPMEELVGESRTGEERGFVGGSEDRENKDGAEATGAWIDDTGEIMVAEGVSEMEESEVVGEIGAAEDAVWETDAAADEVDAAADEVDGAEDDVVNGAEDDVVDGAKDDVVDGAEDDVVDGAEDDVVNGAEDDVVDGAEDDVVNGAEDDVVNGAEDDVVNGAKDDVVDGAEDKVDAPDTGIKGINPEVVGVRADFDNAIDDTGEMGVGEDSGMSNDESEAI